MGGCERQLSPNPERHLTRKCSMNKTHQHLHKNNSILTDWLTWWRVHVPWFSWILSGKFHLGSSGTATIRRNIYPTSRVFLLIPSLLTGKGWKMAGSKKTLSAARGFASVAVRLAACMKLLFSPTVAVFRSAHPPLAASPSALCSSKHHGRG